MALIKNVTRWSNRHLRELGKFLWHYWKEKEHIIMWNRDPLLNVKAFTQGNSDLINTTMCKLHFIKVFTVSDLTLYEGDKPPVMFKQVGSQLSMKIASSLFIFPSQSK